MLREVYRDDQLPQMLDGIKFKFFLKYIRDNCLVIFKGGASACALMSWNFFKVHLF